MGAVSPAAAAAAADPVSLPVQAVAAATADAASLPVDPALRAWIAEQLGEDALSLQPVGQGHHSRGSYVVTTACRNAFYKSVRPDAFDPQEFVAIVAANEEAAELGFGPAVLAVDWGRQALLLAFVDGEVGSDAPEAVARFRRPFLATLRQLHAVTATGRLRLEGPEDDHLACAQLKAAADVAQLAPSLAELSGDVCHGATRALQRLARPLCRTHNDPNPRNMVRCGSVVHLLDWDTLSWGDPLQDIALYALEHGLSIDELPALLVDYQGDTEGLLRLQLYLARLHARRLLTLIVGRPWDVAAQRNARLAAYAELLNHDLKALGPQLTP